jgi:CubicO group peptidase (beta-lactamase class C family)
MAALPVLRALDDWPVPTVAAAVVGPSGVLASHGDTERQFALASVTKPLVARAVQIAIEEGAVDLDTAAGPPGSTVRHLLAHASGLAMLTGQTLARPGTRRMYSNYGFAVLAGTSTVADLAAFAGDLLCPMTVSAEMHAEATTVQFPGLDGVLPGYGVQRPNDWGLGFEIKDSKSPHWTGAHNSPGSYGHFGQSGTLIWADPRAKLALVVLTDRDFGDWALPLWPAISDSVLAAYNSD